MPTRGPEKRESLESAQQQPKTPGASAETVRIEAEKSRWDDFDDALTSDVPVDAGGLDTPVGDVSDMDVDGIPDDLDHEPLNVLNQRQNASKRLGLDLHNLLELNFTDVELDALDSLSRYLSKNYARVDATEMNDLLRSPGSTDANNFVYQLAIYGDSAAAIDRATGGYFSRTNQIKSLQRDIDARLNFETLNNGEDARVDSSEVDSSEDYVEESEFENQEGDAKDKELYSRERQDLDEDPIEDVRLRKLNSSEEALAEAKDTHDEREQTRVEMSGYASELLSNETLLKEVLNLDLQNGDLSGYSGIQISMIRGIQSVRNSGKDPRDTLRRAEDGSIFEESRKKELDAIEEVERYIDMYSQ